MAGGMKVGELARRVGVSVRTLHHYEEIGLLAPSHRTGSGHRLYGRDDLQRLQQIVSLRQLGFSLDRTRVFLADSSQSPLPVIEMHIAALQDQIGAQRQLCERLEEIARMLKASEDVSVDRLLETMEMIMTIERYYTPEQMDQLKKRAQTLGQDRIRAVEREWPELIAAVRAEMEKGTDPAGETMQRLAARWNGLVAEFTGGDAGIESSLRTMYRNEPEVGQRFGLDPEIFQYVKKAVAASNKGQ